MHAFKNAVKYLSPITNDISFPGSLTVVSWGELHRVSDKKTHLYPIGYKCTRVFWSAINPGQRCVYTCTILEVRQNARDQVEDTYT